MMDSSPVALPPVPRPLKRSASLASLPTPPRTRHRDGKRRGQSRGSLASDSDSDSAAGVFTESSEDEAEKNCGKANTHKRRRTNETLEDEDAFWLGGAKSGVTEGKAQGKILKKGSSFKAKAVASDPEAEMTQRDVPLVYQRLQQQREQRSGSGSELIQKHDKTDTKSGAVVASLVSPPPSRRRQPARAAAVTVRTSSPPVTPTKPKRGKKRIQQLAEEFPVRDSPNNPFLDFPSDGKGKAPNVNPKSFRTPPPLGEKPTVTYVFRGVRGVYPNPLYNHAKQRPLSPPPQSLLPPEHPDYSPDMRCPPRLLFPKAIPDSHTSSHWSDDSGSLEPSTPTRSKPNKAATLSGTDKYKERRKEKDEILHLPRMKAVAPLGGHEHAGRVRKARRNPSPDQTLGESDGENEDDTDGDAFGKIMPLKLDFKLEGGEAKNAGNSKHVKSKNRKGEAIPSSSEDEFSRPIAPLEF